MPSASRAEVRWPNAMRATSCANRTSISASVRTLAAVASAKAKNQNCEATAPARPADSEGFHARKIANRTAGLRSARYTDNTTACMAMPTASVDVAAIT